MASRNDGAPGIDGVTFEAIEESGAETFLVQIRDELVTDTFRPMPAQKRKFQKTGEKKSASFRFLQSVMEWCRGR